MITYRLFAHRPRVSETPAFGMAFQLSSSSAVVPIPTAADAVPAAKQCDRCEVKEGADDPGGQLGKPDRPAHIVKPVHMIDCVMYMYVLWGV